MLKRLADAERDQDMIYGVIEGWGINQDGKTNGITAPNLESQTRLEQEVYDKYQIDPGNIQLIEAHGTGTKLGDPIEVEGLKKAFKKYTQKQGVLRAGLCEEQHRSLLDGGGNCRIHQTHAGAEAQTTAADDQLRAAERAYRFKRQPVLRQQRIAGVGVEGSRKTAGRDQLARLQRHQCSPGGRRVSAAGRCQALSVRYLQRQKLSFLCRRGRQNNCGKKPTICWILSGHSGTRLTCIDGLYAAGGREAMEERLGLVVSSVRQLAEKLEAYVEGEQGIEDAYQGQVKRNKEALSLFSTDGDLQQTIDKWIANRKVSKLLELWAKGLDVDWSKLYGEVKPQRMSLPKYPFARDRYWIDAAMGGKVIAKETAAAVLHPLLHSNTSDLAEQSYSSSFSGEEFFSEGPSSGWSKGPSCIGLPGDGAGCGTKRCTQLARNVFGIAQCRLGTADGNTREQTSQHRVAGAARRCG